MLKQHGLPPKPCRRLLRTFLKRPRSTSRFAAPIPFDEAVRNPPDLEDVRHWGAWQLLQDTVFVLHRDASRTWRRHIVCMPAGDEELAGWDHIERGWDRRTSRAAIHTAVVHLPDGSRHKAKRTTGAADYATRGIAVTFKPLRPGVIVEIDEQHDDFRPDGVAAGMWCDEYLQGAYPFGRVRFTAAVADPFRRDFKFVVHHSNVEPVRTEVDDYDVYCWDLNDVPAFETDEYLPAPSDFAPRVEITTLPSWEPIARHFVKDLEPPEKTPAPVQKLANELTASAGTDRDKLLAVHSYTSQDVRYGRHPHKLYDASARTADDLLEELRGDCKDKSALAASMLRELGFPARVVVVRTAVNGRQPMLPSPVFDHAVVRTELDGEEVWLDPAAGPCTFRSIPQNDQGVPALILCGDEFEYSTTPAPAPADHRHERLCRGRFDDAGGYSFAAEVCSSGDFAHEFRVKFSRRSEEHRRRALCRVVASDLTGAEVADAEFEPLDDLSTDVKYRYTMTLPKWGRRVEQILLYRIPWLMSATAVEPMSENERSTPMRAPDAMSAIDRHEIEPPPGFAGYGLPFEVKAECEWADYECAIRDVDGLLICTRRFDLKGGVIPPEKYPEVKRFWETCVRADAADVVLMRTERM